MSEFRDKIQSMIVNEIENRSNNFLGVIVDYDHKSRSCTADISNPTGLGNIRLYNLIVPVLPGFFISKIERGFIVTINAPQGNFSHAEIVAIKPPERNYNIIRNKMQLSRTPKNIRP